MRYYWKELNFQKTVKEVPKNIGKGEKNDSLVNINMWEVNMKKSK